jgi:hypothetical protein
MDDNRIKEQFEKISDEKLNDKEKAVKILNIYRNYYYQDGYDTEHGIIALAINTILPGYINQVSDKNKEKTNLISIVKEPNFEENKKRWLDACEKDENMNSRYKEITFPVGTKLSIDVEITDTYLSEIIMGLLIAPERIQGSENLGFKVKSISYIPSIDRQKIVEHLRLLADKIANGDLK